MSEALAEQATVAAMVSPAPGSVLPGASATFSWHAPDPTAGPLALPVGFVDMGVSFSRSARGNYSTSFSPTTYAATWGIATNIFVDAVYGSDTAGTGTSSAPFKTVGKALATAQADPSSAAQVTIKTHGRMQQFTQGQFNPKNPNITAKRIYITNDNHTYMTYATTAATGLRWEAISGLQYTYRAARSSVSSVADMADLDGEGVPKPYRLYAAIEDVEKTPGSWYRDGSYVYLHTRDGGVPTSNQLVLLAASLFDLNLGADAEVFVRDVCFVGGSHGTYIYNQAGDHTDLKYVEYHTCHSDASSDSVTPANGISVESVKAAQFYHTVFSYNGADGWNLHYRGANPDASLRRTYYGLCFACSSHDNGLYSQISQQNAYTSHEGASVAVIDSVGYHNHGSTFAFVNGEDIVLIGDRASGNSSTYAKGTAEYYASNCSHLPGLMARVYMDDIWGEAAQPEDSQGFELMTDGTVPVDCVYCDLRRVDARTIAEMTDTPSQSSVQYRLDVGSRVGASDIASINAGSSSAVTVDRLPTDGSKVYVRLSSWVGGTWKAQDYAFTAARSIPRE